MVKMEKLIFQCVYACFYFPLQILTDRKSTIEIDYYIKTRVFPYYRESRSRQRAKNIPRTVAKPSNLKQKQKQKQIQNQTT